ncbi:DUF418 domain-containing protein [Brevibacillus daliensis]|uniref:DUF418 domain-containing protein n=1 Tax=Brevibacillus daliensis TaxID=2892995 RepID=UPI001E534846|nr:DUF418 domain-containing protein [Brevibacillus daliensis]
MANRIQTISTSNRIYSIDVIRGFAIFGILLVNLPDFVPFEVMNYEYYGVNLYVRLLMDIFIQVKFFPIFSFLFGLSFYVLMSNLESRRVKYKYIIIIRRLLGLFLIGMLHQLIWFGDILEMYSKLGLFLIPFYWLSAKVVLWAIIILCTLFYTSTLLIIIEPVLDYVTSFGGYGFLTFFSTAPSQVFLMYLLGLYVGKKLYFKNIAPQMLLIKKVQIISFFISIPFIFLIIWRFIQIDGMVDTTYVALSSIPMSLFYISTLVILLEQQTWKKILKPFSYVGKTALSNYLLQTLLGLCTYYIFNINTSETIFLNILIVCGIFYFQVVISNIWLRYFRQGPVEYVLRTWTYGLKYKGYFTDKNV